MNEKNLLEITKKEFLQQISLAKETGNYERQLPLLQKFLNILEVMPDNVFEFEKTWYVKPDQDLEKQFTEICNFLDDPKIRDKNLAELSKTIRDLYSKNYENWKNFIEQIHSIRDIIYSADYHIKQIDDLQISLDQSLRKQSQQIHNQTMAYGNLYTRKLDYEFQAFILKIRASLDYFKQGVRLCYKEVDSNDFPKFIKSLPINLKSIYKRYQSDLNDNLILSHNKETVRDLLTHQKYITLGTINTFYGENSGESFLILNTGRRIELKDIQKFLFEKRDVVANFLIASIWAIIKS
jgi:hypothetical protein